jgi:hypothetical protein
MLPGAGIPQLRGPVLTPGEDAALIVTELRPINLVLVLESRADGLSGTGIPQLRGLVLTPGEDAAFVVTELRPINLFLVLESRADGLSGAGIPQLRGLDPLLQVRMRLSSRLNCAPLTMPWC